MQEQLTTYSAYGTEVNSDKINILYNEENLISGIKIYKWEEDTNAWIETNNETILYNDKAKLSEYIFAGNKFVIEYNENHLMKQIAGLILFNDQYINNAKYKFNYDQNGNLLSQISSRWNTDENNWEKYHKIENKFDLSFINQSDIILPEYSYSLNSITN